LRSSPLLPIFLIVVVDVLGYTLILPLLPFYAERLGATPAIIGFLIATYAVCQLITGPLIGRSSDHIGRRPMLLLTQVGTFVGFVILAAANSLWLVFLSRIIDGVTAGNLSLAQAYIADVTRPEDRARSFGMIGIAFGLGFLVGPAVSGFLSTFGYHYPIVAAAGLSLVSINATYFLLPANPPRPAGHDEGPVGPGGERLTLLEWNRYLEYFRRPVLAPLLWKFFAFVFSFSLFTAGFALFAERRYTWNGHPFGPKEVGYIFAYSGLIGGALQGGMLGRLVKRFGERPLLAAGFLSAVAGYIALGFAYTIPELIFATTIAALGGVIRPVVTSLITQVAGRREQGTVLGLTQSLTSMAQITAPVIAGFLIQHMLLIEWAVAAGAVTAVGWFIRAPEPAMAHQPVSHRR
jgi:DHA1 family tetracycline resistance protein-like MFS transporter